MFKLQLMTVNILAVIIVGAEAAAGTPVDAENPDDPILIVIERTVGFADVNKPIDQYRFNLTANGKWRFKPRTGEAKTGWVSGEDVDRFVESIEKGGLRKVKSEPTRGFDDRDAMHIVVRVKKEKVDVTIGIDESLSKLIEAKIVDLAKPDK